MLSLKRLSTTSLWCGQHVVCAALMLVQHVLFGRELEKKEKEEKERQKEERKRAERQHRDAFKALLDKHRAAGVLGPKMRWKVQCFFVREMFLLLLVCMLLGPIAPITCSCMRFCMVHARSSCAYAAGKVALIDDALLGTCKYRRRGQASTLVAI